MKAIIQNIETNENDFQHPQVDVEIIYEHKDFPADHQFEEGGKRKYIFTFPYDEFQGMTEEDLNKKITLQGNAFKELLDKNKEMKEIKNNLQDLIGNEVEI